MAEEQQTPNGETTPTQPPIRAADVAGPAVIGVGGYEVTGEPIVWLWNEVLSWVIDSATVPVMPLPVGRFFGGLILAAGYGIYRLIRSRRSAQ